MHLDDTSLPATLEQHFGFSVAIGVYAQSALADESRFPIVANRCIPSALHVLKTASLEKLSELGGFSDTDRRRFRPSILIESEEQNVFLENNWIGNALQIGDMRCNVVEGTKRCGMTLIAQPWAQRGSRNSAKHLKTQPKKSWRLLRCKTGWTS
ncbi:MOSC domain-containing protein [Rhizobium sp. PL01]|uniref:MOSC domain-containing protein n=1 Tax=Rhizobium sp. PL01 TaxID=3085631 RepID=UPI00298221FF|nr:MOSC domain-containing protein [Rhizobium sp. PL01]MDW5317177.1 MOSC domain-containing protein [Rhizobium sp. PL01]